MVEATFTYLVEAGLSKVAAAFVTAAVVITGSYVAARVFAPNIPDIRADAAGRQQVVRAPSEPFRVVYGWAMVGGVLVWAATRGTDNGTLDMVITLAGHEIAAVEQVYLNDQPIEAWGALAAYEAHLGAPDQAADATLAAAYPDEEWSTDHRGRGVAYLRVTLTWDFPTSATKQAWPGGIPRVKALVRGKQDILDPRTGTRGYTNNWSLCVADYLTYTGGLQVPSAKVDWDSVTAAANVADQQIKLRALDGVAVMGGQYVCNGAFEEDQDRLAVIEDMRQAGAGAVFPAQGLWRVHAGAPAVAVRRIDADDLRGPVGLRVRPERSQLFNSLVPAYVSPAHSWQVTPLAPVTDPAWVAADGGAEYRREAQYNWCVDQERARRLAAIEIKAHRLGAGIALPLTLEAGLGLQPWDVITLDLAHLGYAGKQFRITSVALTAELGVDIEAEAYDADVYAWTAADYQANEFERVETLTETVRAGGNWARDPGGACPATVPATRASFPAEGLLRRLSVVGARSTERVHELRRFGSGEGSYDVDGSFCRTSIVYTSAWANYI